jgi:hypothetical protein
MPISAAQLNKQEKAEFLTPLTSEARPFQKMEEVQKVADAYWPEQVSHSQRLTQQSSVPVELQEQATKIIDQIAEHYGHKSLSLRLLELNERIALAAEGFVTRKKNKEHEKKEKIEGKNLPDQTSWKNWQATWYGTAGFGSAFLQIAGGVLGDHPVGKVLTSLSALGQPGAEMTSKYIDAQLTGLNHEHSYFLNTTQAEKQALEGLKNLPKEVQQLIKQLADAEMQAWRSIGQRG